MTNRNEYDEKVKAFERDIPIRLAIGNICLKCGRVMTGNDLDGLHALECLIKAPDAEEFWTAASGNPNAHAIILNIIGEAGLMSIVEGGTKLMSDKTVLNNPTESGKKILAIEQGIHYKFTISNQHVDPPMEIEFYVGGAQNRREAMMRVESIGAPLANQMETQVKEARAAGKTVVVYCDSEWWGLFHRTSIKGRRNVSEAEVQAKLKVVEDKCR